MLGRLGWGVLLALVLAGGIQAGETGHYVHGLEGIKAATVPGPGLYLRNYNAYYHSDKLTDADGDNAHAGLDADIFAAAWRLIWVTPYKFLGADYGMHVILPTQSTDMEMDAAGVDDNQAGIGDIDVAPIILSWHKQKFDLVAAYEFYAPTGQWDQRQPAQPGKDFWTHMFTFGGTYYFDCNKTWAASILARYEIHGEKGHQEITAGDDFHFEWGISKTLGQLWEVGVVGYSQWQVSDDKGSDVTWDRSVHDQVHAVGLEVSRFFIKPKLNVSLRHEQEFYAVDRPQGHITMLTMTKVF